MGPTGRVEDVVEPLLHERGLELVDVEAKPGLLRISVDRPGGVDLETIGAVSTVLSAALDEVDPVPGRYTLEVSSPGLERPLRTPAHFRRFVGTTIVVRTQPEVAGERRVEGTLEAADDEGVVVAGRRLAYTDIERARTVFTWGGAPKPGQPKTKPKTKTMTKTKDRTKATA